MIYGAQQTIKLIRLSVFPEEGPAGGCSGLSPAPSLFGPPLPSSSLPSESPGRFLCVFLSHCVLLQLTCAGVVLVCPERHSVLSDTGPITKKEPKLAVEHHAKILCQQDFGFQPLPPNPPT